MTPNRALELAIKWAEKGAEAGLSYADQYARQGQLWVAIARELRAQQETPA